VEKGIKKGTYYCTLSNTLKHGNMKSSMLTHITAAMLFSLVVLLVYATVQQTYRSAANDPQMQLARDIADDIKYTRSYRYYLDNAVDPRQSLGTFMQLYNENGQLLFSGGTIHGKAPQIPKGVLDNAKQYTENAVTWQPTADVRLASVTEYTMRPDTAYVVVARSMMEVENREARLTQMIMLIWTIGVGIIAVHWFIQGWINKIAL
jgi:hypothetical protein